MVARGWKQYRKQSLCAPTRPCVVPANLLPVPQVQTWVDAYENRVAWQVQHMKNETASAGLLETQLREVRDTLTYRRFSVRNRERLNRTLPPGVSS